MTDIKPYSISVPDSRLQDLKQRLALATYPDELENSNWDLGAPLSDIERLTKYWHQEFDWRKAEAELNKLPHFTTNIQCDGFGDLSIHFIHAPSKVKDAIPLLFVHGWPGNFLEVTKILKPLTEGGDGHPAFHVVAPSLPNFGFSQGVQKRGFSMEQYASTCDQLMQKLGYDQYVTQGGDWGWFITRSISLLFPNHCRATHLNMDIANFQTSILTTPNDKLPMSSNFSARDEAGLERGRWFEREGFGYNMLQATKPQTIGYALADSPVALLAWIYEKHHDWTDSYPWTPDEILTWISIYWFSTAGPAASLRIYYEILHDAEGTHVSQISGKVKTSNKLTRQVLSQPQENDVKIGQSHFPKELHVMPEGWTRTISSPENYVFERFHTAGGHFAAWERPQNIIADLRDMFGKGGGAAGCVEGRSGY